MIKPMECAIVNLIIIELKKYQTQKLSNIVYILITQTHLFDVAITVTLYISECSLSNNSPEILLWTTSIPFHAQKDEIKRNEISQTKSSHKSVLI
jgi:hypothetical protein